MFSLKRRKPAPKRPDVRVEKAPDQRPKALKLLMDLRPEAQRTYGPGPSKIAYRMSRAWKKAWLRKSALLGLPLVMLALVGWRVASDPSIHQYLAQKRDTMMAALSARPEFAVVGIDVAGASDALALDVRETVGLTPQTSSLTLDVAAVQARVAALGAVKAAHVMLDPEGVLKVSVVERVPEALWRDEQGDLWLLDREGYAIALVLARADRPDLPVVIGEGADEVVHEALALFNAQPGLRGRLRALIRVGKRRWNLALDRDLTIMLPEKEPGVALDRVMALHYGEELLDRDLQAVDMRVGQRPTLRMSRDAYELYRLRNAVGVEAGKDT